MRWGLVEKGYVFVLFMAHALLIRSGRAILLFPALVYRKRIKAIFRMDFK